MARMRRILLLAVMCAACSRDKPPDPPPREPEVRLPALAEKQLYDWRLSLPEEWWEGAMPYQNHGMLFYGPEDDGFKPCVQMWLRPWQKTAEQFFEVERGRRDVAGGSVTILEEGRAVVAGLPADYLVYLQKERDPKTNEMRDFVTIDWYFVKDRVGWILRGLSTARTFQLKYRPLFTEVKRRLRYSPP
jgi:hypothetical protein